MPKKKKSEAKSQQKEAIKNCKLYLDLDLSSKSAGGLLPYKFLLDYLTKAIENKKIGSVIVHHYIKGTEEKDEEDELMEGKQGEKYTTSPKLDLENR